MSERGLSVIESLLVLALLSALIVPSLQLFDFLSNGHEQNRQRANRLYASSFLQGALTNQRICDCNYAGHKFDELNPEVIELETLNSDCNFPDERFLAEVGEKLDGSNYEVSAIELFIESRVVINRYNASLTLRLQGSSAEMSEEVIVVRRQVETIDDAGEKLITACVPSEGQAAEGHDLMIAESLTGSQPPVGEGVKSGATQSVSCPPGYFMSGLRLTRFLGTIGGESFSGRYRGFEPICRHLKRGNKQIMGYVGHPYGSSSDVLHSYECDAGHFLYGMNINTFDPSFDPDDYMDRASNYGLLPEPFYARRLKCKEAWDDGSGAFGLGAFSTVDLPVESGLGTTSTECADGEFANGLRFRPAIPPGASRRHQQIVGMQLSCAEVSL